MFFKNWLEYSDICIFSVQENCCLIEAAESILDAFLYCARGKQCRAGCE